MALALVATTGSWAVASDAPERTSSGVATSSSAAASVAGGRFAGAPRTPCERDELRQQTEARALQAAGRRAEGSAAASASSTATTAGATGSLDADASETAELPAAAPSSSQEPAVEPAAEPASPSGRSSTSSSPSASAPQGAALTSPSGGTTSTSTSASASASGERVPTGDLPGWRQVFRDDFQRDAPLGSFPGSAYGSTWGTYDGWRDTSGAGLYAESRIVSVSGGVMDIHLRTEGGQALVAAPNVRGGQKYGRYSVRFRTDRIPGYKTAWLLWPDSDVWAQGEIDFPEGSLDDDASGFVHCPGDPARNCLAVDTGTGFDGAWHTATTEWTPSGVVFLMDGREVGRTATSPSVSMHWVLQTETDHGRPSASSQGHVQVDWVSVWAMA